MVYNKKCPSALESVNEKAWFSVSWFLRSEKKQQLLNTVVQMKQKCKTGVIKGKGYLIGGAMKGAGGNFSPPLYMLKNALKLTCQNRRQ